MDRFRSFLLLPVQVILFTLNLPLQAQNQVDPTNFELNTVLMESTFKIEGRTASGQQTIGTAFVMGRPYDKPPADQPTKAAYVLITAAHVLDEIRADTAVLHYRRK